MVRFINQTIFMNRPKNLFVVAVALLLIGQGCASTNPNNDESSNQENMVKEEVATEMLAVPADQKNTPAVDEMIVEEKNNVVEEKKDVMEKESTVTKALQIKSFSITADQWSFKPDTITVNKGDTVKIEVKSVDVAHGFAIPTFGVNKKFEAGETINVEFVADKSGTFPFFCSVFCGAGHSSMKGSLIVN